METKIIIIGILLILMFILMIFKQYLLIELSILFLAFMLFFGWGLYGCLNTTSYYITKENVEVAKTKSWVIVFFKDNHIEKYDRISECNEINDSTNFYKITYYNMYGVENSNSKYIYGNIKADSLNKKIIK